MGIKNKIEAKTKHWRERREVITLVLCLREWKIVKPLWKLVWLFIKKKNRITI